MHYLCDAIIRFTFDDAHDPQVLNFEIIGEIGGTMYSLERQLRWYQANYIYIFNRAKLDNIWCRFVDGRQSRSLSSSIKFYLQHTFEKPYPSITYNVIPYNQFETVMINI
ncbi:MAG: hypothetical protein EZS28_029385 [Streblomastix strix]|uniref:Uncharacterized protein n=1 Tax=Streblomastix strix TaxID=222440 RepID=A0A5J4UXM1_9EUKA|nr:MAG: hypothetical protein EZS28_029385 [Streblomastix strix]